MTGSRAGSTTDAEASRALASVSSLAPPAGDERAGRKDARVVTAVALSLRLAVAAWAGATIPPTADGTYYHLLATRIASGQGYTWLWPDGVVTHAAHYPVGYPALIAGGYVLFGAKPVVAMIVNALIGTAGAWAAHDLLRRATSRWLAMAGGLAVAMHPALVPYTAALMTEGVATALLVVATAFAERAHRVDRVDRVDRADRADRADGSRAGGVRWMVACGVVMGAATLMRPQLVVFAPLLGWLAARASTTTSTSTSTRVAARGAVIVTLVALAVCAPWTARNCVRMERCALVSVNGGWNLAIGTQTVSGGWQEMAVPDACKEVFAEAAKDECFARAARSVISADPLGWLARAPAKMRVTFDYFGAAPWYLHAANAEAFPYSAKVALGTIETVVSRLLLLAALVAVRKLDGPRRLMREGTTALGLLACFVPGVGVIAYLACAAAILMVGARELARLPRIVPATAAVVLITAATHAVFFGAGRYGLLVVPFIAALAFVRPERAPSPSS